MLLHYSVFKELVNCCYEEPSFLGKICKEEQKLNLSVNGRLKICENKSVPFTYVYLFMDAPTVLLYQFRAVTISIYSYRISCFEK